MKGLAGVRVRVEVRGEYLWVFGREIILHGVCWKIVLIVAEMYCHRNI